MRTPLPPPRVPIATGISRARPGVSRGVALGALGRDAVARRGGALDTRRRWEAQFPTEVKMFDITAEFNNGRTTYEARFPPAFGTLRARCVAFLLACSDCCARSIMRLVACFLRLEHCQVVDPHGDVSSCAACRAPRVT